jgi:hypothetical protein
MQPEIWGKYLWMMIHIVALGYPNEPTEDDKINYKIFYEHLSTILPCYSCAEHYKKHIEKNPLTNDVMKDTKSLFNWTVDMHNVVNKFLKKTRVTYEQAYTYYTINLPAQNDHIQECLRSITTDSNKLSNNKHVTVDARRVCIAMNILIICVVLFWFMRCKKF